MSSNPKDNYWDVGPLGEVRSFGLALADSGESVRGGGGDKKAKVLERVRRDASPSFKGDMGDKTVRGIKRNLKLMKGSEIQQEEKESENESDEEMMEERSSSSDQGEPFDSLLGLPRRGAAGLEGRGARGQSLGRGGRRSRGRVVTPGYIDNYSQSDSESNVSETPQLRQHGESDSSNSSFGV